MISGDMNGSEIAISLPMRNVRSFLGMMGAAFAVMSVGCATEIQEVDGAEGAAKVKNVTAADRASYLKNITLRDAKASIRSKNLFLGPESKDGFKHDELVTCTFVEPEEAYEGTGKTEKFECTLPSGEEVKVKYARVGNDEFNNKEVFSEVLGTRILWGLGYHADRVYPVQVKCLGCPDEPWEYVRTYRTGQPKSGRRSEQFYRYAAIERKFDAEKIEEQDKPNQGIHFAEFVPGERADKAEIDAFKLLAAFIKHGDNKADNQRLVCMKGGITFGGKCSDPAAMIQDTGATFGGTDSSVHYKKKMSYSGWADSLVWKNLEKCQASLVQPYSVSTMTDPVVSEEGRALLASLLSQLSNEQLMQAFKAARVDALTETYRAPDTIRKPTLEEWVKLFNFKRDQIIRPKCP